MAAGWVHETIDLITYGRAYRHIHQRKDAHSQEIPGLQHRQKDHEWYLNFQKKWDFPNPFPDFLKETIQNLKESFGAETAEERMSSDSHDYIDRHWDSLSKTERNYNEGYFVWLIYHPEILKTRIGLDVIDGKILRTIDGNKVWEDSPDTITDYKRLRRDVSRHHKGRFRFFENNYS